MLKVLHIRGDKDYFNKKNDLLYSTSTKFVKEENILSRDRVRIKENRDGFFGYKNILLAWDKCFNIPYYSFREQLRAICVNDIEQLNYFDLILYNDQEYIDYIQSIKDDTVMFSHDDDDIFLPSIHNIEFSPGANVYSYTSLTLLHEADKPCRIITRSKNRSKIRNGSFEVYRIKSGHYCSYYKDGLGIPPTVLSNHQNVHHWCADNMDTLSFWDVSFDLHIKHPSSLSFFDQSIKDFFIHNNPDKEEKALMDRVTKCVNNMKNVVEENNIPALNKMYDLYKRLF